MSRSVGCVSTLKSESAEHRVRVAGPVAKAPDAFLVSGLGVPLEYWRPVQEGLVETVRTIAYDRSGMPGSSPLVGTPTPHARARQLVDLVRVVSGDGPVVLIGHSYGGLIVQHAAALLPPEALAGIVLIDSTHPLQLDVSTRQRRGLPWVEQVIQLAYAGAVLHLWGKRFVDEGLQDLLSQDQQVYDDCVRHPAFWRTTLREFRAWRDEDRSYYAPGSPLSTIAVQGAVLTAEKSLSTDPAHGKLQQRLADGCRCAAPITVQETNHYSILRDPRTMQHLDKSVSEMCGRLEAVNR